MPLRDLREDFRQRLRAIELELAQLQTRVDFLRTSEQHIRFSLKYEEMRVQYENQNLSFPFLAATHDGSSAEVSSSKFRLFLMHALANGQAWSLEDLKKAAIESNIDFDGKQPGRVLHFALIGMSQNGIVEKTDSGLWRMKAEAPTQQQENEIQAKGA